MNELELVLVPLAATDPVAIGALVAGVTGAVIAFLRLPTERRTSIVGAQDVLIENLREEVTRYKAERDEEAARLRTYYEARLADMQRQIDEEKAALAERIAELEGRLSELLG